MASDAIVVLLLAALPLTGNSQLDRGEIAHLAGCIDTPVITIVEDVGRGYVVLVRCYVPPVPTAEILRTDPWGPGRQPATPTMGLPFGVTVGGP